LLFKRLKISSVSGELGMEKAFRVVLIVKYHI